jgi:hypothetical protein
VFDGAPESAPLQEMLLVKGLGLRFHVIF